MKILDRYIIRQFLINFGILFLVLMSLFVLVDVIVDLDEFVKAGRIRAQHRAIATQAERLGIDTVDLEAVARRKPPAEVVGKTLGITLADAQRLIKDLKISWFSRTYWTLWTVQDYYGPTILLVYVFFSGLLVVAAMGFTLSALQRTRELTAILTSGVSMYRIAAPLLITGIILNGLAVLSQELFIPRLAGKLTRSKSRVMHDTFETFPVHYAVDEHGHLFSATDFSARAGTLRDLAILERDERGLAARHIRASQAVWDEDRQGWELIQGFASTPRDSGILVKDPEPVEFVKTELSPTVLMARRVANYPQLMSLSALQKMQKLRAVDPIQRDKISKIKWSRFSLLIVNVLTLVMGLPFFLLRGPANPLLQAVKAACVCIGVWGSTLVTIQVSTGMVNPVVAAWLPVVIFLPCSALLLQMIKT